MMLRPVWPSGGSAVTAIPRFAAAAGAGGGGASRATAAAASPFASGAATLAVSRAGGARYTAPGSRKLGTNGFSANAATPAAAARAMPQAAPAFDRALRFRAGAVVIATPLPSIRCAKVQDAPALWRIRNVRRRSRRRMAAHRLFEQHRQRQVQVVVGRQDVA